MIKNSTFYKFFVGLHRKAEFQKADHQKAGRFSEAELESLF